MQHLKEKGRVKMEYYSYYLVWSSFYVFSLSAIARSVVRFLQPLARFSEMDGHFHATGYLECHGMQQGGMPAAVVCQRFMKATLPGR